MEAVLTYLADHWAMLLGSAALGAGIGVLTGLFGAGGGFILTPALHVFLGLPMPIAAGTSAGTVLGTSSLTLWRQFDRRFLGIRVAGCMGLGIPLGTFLGARLVRMARDLGDADGRMTVFGQAVDATNWVLLSVFAVFLVLVAAWIMIDNFWLKGSREVNERFHRGLLAGVRIPPVFRFRTIPVREFSGMVLVMLGVVMGTLSGLFGIGGGVVMMPALYYLVGQKTKYAVQTDVMVIFASSLFATINHAAYGHVDVSVVVPLLLGGFFGTRVGYATRRAVSGLSIRRYFGFVVVLAVGIVAFRLYRMVRPPAPAAPATRPADRSGGPAATASAPHDRGSPTSRPH